jgi:thiamine pyrophosphate-dependent acetolactate synthase large subunit-like protein
MTESSSPRPHPPTWRSVIAVESLVECGRARHSRDDVARAEREAPRGHDPARQRGLLGAASLNAKAALPDDHPLKVGVPGTYSRWCANRVLSEAHLVFFIGQPCPDRPAAHGPEGIRPAPGQSPRLQLPGRRRSHQRRRRDAPVGVETVGDMKVATSRGLRDAT